MAANRNFHSDINIDQKLMITKVAEYLRALGRDPNFIDGFFEEIRDLADPDRPPEKVVLGYCSGLSALAGACLSRTFNPPEHAGPVDDWAWFISTMQKISQWQPQEPIQEDSDIERLLASVVMFQNIGEYLAPIVARGDLSTNYNLIGERVFTKEYSLAVYATDDELAKIFPDIIKEDRVVIISSDQHEILLMKHAGLYYLYDPGCESGITHDSPYNDQQLSELAKDIMLCMNFEEDEAASLGFRMYTTDEKSAYPSQNEILGKITSFPIAIEDEVVDMMDDEAGPEMLDDVMEEEQSTLLLLAAHIGCIESIKHYLNSGLDVDLANNKGMTALLTAVQQNRPDMISLLADYRANLNKPNTEGGLPICIAANKGSLEVVDMLIRKGANLDLVEADDNHTAVYAAAEAGHLSVLTLLINARANINIPDISGTTPLFVVARKGDLEAVRLLVSNAADIEEGIKLPIRDLINAIPRDAGEICADLKYYCRNPLPQNIHHFTPLQIAIVNGHVDVAKFLINAGASLEKKPGGIAPIDLARLVQNHEMVTILESAATLQPPTSKRQASASAAPGFSIFNPIVPGPRAAPEGSAPSEDDMGNRGTKRKRDQ